MKNFKCGIYIIKAILGSKIGWVYIGKTNGRYDRKYYHFNDLKNEDHHSIKLQRYYNKYGRKSLKWEFFYEYPENELLFWEKFWIATFDSYKNGFNCTKGGENPPDNFKECTLTNIWTKETISKPSIKEFSEEFNVCRSGISQVLSGKINYIEGWYFSKNNWRPKYCNVISPDNVEYEISNIGLKDFCKKHKIKSNGNFRVMFDGKQQTCEGWQRKYKKERIYTSSKIIKLLNPSGDYFECSNIRNFCKKNNLCYSRIIDVISCKCEHHKGWRLYTDNLKNTKFIPKKRKQKVGKLYKFLSPEGVLFETRNLKQFSIEHNLSHSHLSELWNEKKWFKSCKGWTKYKEING